MKDVKLGIDLDTVWAVVTDKLPELKMVIWSGLINSFGRQSST